MGITPNNISTPSEANYKEIGGNDDRGRILPVVFTPTSIIWKIVLKPTEIAIINPIILILTLFVMTPHFLIFPCPLESAQFSTLRVQKNILSTYLVNKIESEDKKLKDLYFYIGCTVFDIDEILKNHNCHGYRCNSYILNKILLKLSYIFEITRVYDFSEYGIFRADFSNVHYNISLILNHQFAVYEEILR